MAHGSQKRITKVYLLGTKPFKRSFVDHHSQELGDLLISPPAGITVSLADESNIYIWKVVMEGPPDSPYAVSGYPAMSLL